MGSIASWNIRGLNWPNKQEDVHTFLHINKVGLIGLLETKVKEKNADRVAKLAFPGWQWQHNFECNPRGRIWIAWRPNFYRIQVLKKTDQLMHCCATQMLSQKHFYITYVYGLNHDHQRTPLWNDLITLGQNMNEAWCLLGDFNAVMYKEDRTGGTDVLDHEVQDMNNLIDLCGLQEMKWVGNYFSWSNKKVWSRIDRVFTNILWYENMDFSQTHYLSNSLSDHSPLLLQFSHSPRPQTRFSFCDMWLKHKDFWQIIASSSPDKSSHSEIARLKNILDRIRPQLIKLNRQYFADLREQIIKARFMLTELQSQLANDRDNMHLAHQERILRLKYVDIISSSLSLIQQQCKIEWIKYGDDNTRLFHARARQRKLTTYTYSLADVNGTYVEGFDKVQQLMFDHFKTMLGNPTLSRCEIDPLVIQ